MISPFIAIIVLNWNQISDTSECLRSLLRLEYDNYRVIAIDNDSQDHPGAIISQEFPHVTLICNPKNLGYAEGNNVGIRHALDLGADYILILNNDTIVDPGMLQAFVDCAQAHPEAGVFSGAIYWYSSPSSIWFAGNRWDTTKASFVPHNFKEAEDLHTAPDPIETDYASGCALFFRAEVARAIGVFDPRFFLIWEEADWCYRAKKHGYKILVAPNAKIWHKVSRSFQDQIFGAHAQYYYTRNRMLWIEKNLNLGQKISAFLRCLREVYWHGLETRQQGLRLREDRMFRSKVLGLYHYTIRRFGPGPSFS